MRLPQHHRRMLVVAALAVLVVVCGLSGAMAAVGGQNRFCTAGCHEMRPLTIGLQHSAHRGVPCLDCHGRRGVWHVIGQELAAVRSLVAHIGGRGISPDTRADVPNERCRRCHRGASMPTLVTLSTVEFRHELHTGRSGIRCAACHRTVAHGSATGTGDARESGALTRPATERACLACHTGEQALACARCHVDAGHRPRGACGDCHRRGDWVRGLKFRHEPTLGKAHRALTCETCHREGVRRRSLRCATCHASAHGGLMACGRCHLPARWKPARFSHPAVGPHESDGAVTVACDSCHPSGYTTASCSCHQQPADHPALAAHAGLSCRACHMSAVGGTSTPGCASCHGTPHPGLTGCAACHGMREWTAAVAAHGGTPHVDEQGPRLRCTACHVYGYAAASCTCHSGNRHRPQALRGAHASIACGRCHDAGYGPRPGGCSSCHRSPHGGPATCARCHDTSSWVPAGFVHRTVAPHVPAASPALTCVDCHHSGFMHASCSCHATPSPSPSATPSPSSTVTPEAVRDSEPESVTDWGLQSGLKPDAEPVSSPTATASSGFRPAHPVLSAPGDSGAGGSLY